VPGHRLYPRPERPHSARLGHLASVAGAVIASGDEGVLVTGVTHASGEIRPGDLFAALPGANAHGARFARAAAEAGAVAMLTDAAGAPAGEDAGLAVMVVDDPRAQLGVVANVVYGEPAGRLKIIGLTGTAGKTSTSYMVESGLRAAGHVTGLIGTVETRLGDLIVDSVRTTPEAGDLHGLFAAGLERGVTAVVMEVSSHALVLGRVGGVRFDVAGYTNFGSDHLDFHKDPDDYFAAKALLFDGRADVEVLNHDDAALRPLYTPATVTYSANGDPDATWRATDIVDDGYGQSFLAYGPDGAVVKAGVALPGRHNVANALLAIACLVGVGIDAQLAANGVAACAGVPGRLERVDGGGPVIGVVDYAHKPDSIVAALDALREIAGAHRVIAVLGAGGDRDRGKRPVMGAAAAQGSDLLIVTDDNPRTEDPAVIRAEVMRGAVEASAAAEIIEVDGRRAAIAEAVRQAWPGDVIGLLGKGHERGQEIQGEIHPFDDRVELARALAERFGVAPSPQGAETVEERA
jgi:UDP-N-acetylmuramoyl-L-alanyl-D-glutamate--2,6-diaminopimelate ligase